MTWEDGGEGESEGGVKRVGGREREAIICR